MRVEKKTIYGWGRTRKVNASTHAPSEVSQVKIPNDWCRIARGGGRSYNDASVLADGLVIETCKLRRVKSFNDERGTLKIEAGALLSDVLAFIVPRGWFLAVTPGTKRASVGGCVAADVHGKNHHRAGAFGKYVRELELLTVDGEILRLSPEENSEVYRATIGGMGLTGLILNATLQLIPIETSLISVRCRRTKDLDDSLGVFDEHYLDDEYTVAWIDCLANKKELGRGVFVSGHHATREEIGIGSLERPIYEPRKECTLPDFVPKWVLNRWSMRAFNLCYYLMKGRKEQNFFSRIDEFFYPLDAVTNWNVLYGRKGFSQYQCVFPTAQAERGIKKIIQALSRSRIPCFLCVLKRLGAKGDGLLSFPIPGYTLALDLPADEGIEELVHEFDRIVVESQGRIYLAKNPIVRKELLKEMYAELPQWIESKDQLDPRHRFRSDMSTLFGLTR